MNVSLRGQPLVCVVTGGAARASGNELAEYAERAAAAGVDLFQIREPQLTDASLLSAARRAVTRARGTRMAVLINDRLDVAEAGGAAGVHLRADSVPATRVRAVAPRGFLLGRSVHSAAEALAAERTGGLDYLLFGTVFPSAGKPANHVIAGIEELGRTCEAVRLPVLAIGGISVERARAVAAAGAAGVAAIGLFRDAYHAPGGLAPVVETIKLAFDTR